MGGAARQMHAKKKKKEKEVAEAAKKAGRGKMSLFARSKNMSKEDKVFRKVRCYEIPRTKNL